MYIQAGIFNLNNEETIKLEGNYEIKTVEHEIKDYYDNRNIPNHAVYVKGNILYRKDTDNIDEFINLFIRYTSDPCQDLDLDFSIKNVKICRSGTICPARRALFVYKNKVFVAYGRYIFGYDQGYVIIKRGTDEIGDLEADEVDPNYEEGKDDDEWEDLDYEEYNIKEHKIENDKIILGVPESNDFCNEYVYSFLIYDKDTKVVDAFGMHK